MSQYNVITQAWTYWRKLEEPIWETLSKEYDIRLYQTTTFLPFPHRLEGCIASDDLSSPNTGFKNLLSIDFSSTLEAVRGGERAVSFDDEMRRQSGKSFKGINILGEYTL